MSFALHYFLLSSFIFLWTAFCHVSDGAIDVHTNGNKLGTSYFFYQHSSYPRDCHEVKEQCPSHNSSGVFMIKPDGYLEPFEIYCDSADGSGWTVIQRRVDGSINFNRNWESYQSGFGFLSGEFWIGNEKLSYLTNQKDYELIVEMTTSEGYLIRVLYDSFRLSDGFSNYTLRKVGEYSGITDGITYCPTNMVFANCSSACHRTCAAPAICQGVVCSGAGVCVCPEGFFMEGTDCVPREVCGCYEPEGDTIVHEGEFTILPACTRKGVCTNGQIDWVADYACSAVAVCEVRENVRQCYCPDGYTGDGETCTRLTRKDCQEVYEDGNTDSGIYRILPTGWMGSTFEVYCNMSDGGGWTVFQRRIDGRQDFHLDWDEYKEGFGNRDHEFWLGNDKLHYLTNQKRYEVRIDLVNKYGAPYYAKFDFFRINDESDNYRLSGVGAYSGTADSRASPDGIQLTYHLNQQFSTKDRDNDKNSNNCAFWNNQYRNGGWWYNNCYASRLNGQYGPCNNCFVWKYLPGNYDELKFSEMKVRPI